MATDAIGYPCETVTIGQNDIPGLVRVKGVETITHIVMEGDICSGGNGFPNVVGVKEKTYTVELDFNNVEQLATIGNIDPVTGTTVTTRCSTYPGFTPAKSVEVSITNMVRNTNGHDWNRNELAVGNATFSATSNSVMTITVS